MDLFERAQQLLTLDHSFGEMPVDCGRTWMRPPKQEQHILRMMITSPETGVRIPNELSWIIPMMQKCRLINEHRKMIQPFVYVTVRNGYVKTTRDADWHVDGFSMRVPHKLEQDYLWCDHTGTQVLDQQIDIPKDFDPLQHNLHTYLDEQVQEENIVSMKAGNMYLTDPYIVHRRDPSLDSTIWRSFVRLSYLPIEIEDDTCTPNPLMPKKHYGRTDIRTTLTRYVG